MRKELLIVGAICILSLSGCSKGIDETQNDIALITETVMSNGDKCIEFMGKAINSGSMDTVNRIYAKSNNVEDVSISDKAQIDNMVSEFYKLKLDSVIDNYNKTSDEKEIAELEIILNSYETLDINNELNIEEVKGLQDSKEWFRKGKKFEGEGNYTTAIRCYSRMSKEDYNYTEAVNRMDKCRNEYLKTLIAEVDQYIKEWRFDSAFKLANKLSTIENEQTVNIVEDTKTRIENYFKEDIAYMVNANFNKCNYIELFKLLDLCEQYYSGNQELIEFRNKAWEIKESNERTVVVAVYNYTRMILDSNVNLDSLDDYMNSDIQNLKYAKEFLESIKHDLENYKNDINDNYIITYETSKYINKFDELNSITLEYLRKVEEFMNGAEDIMRENSYYIYDNILYDYLYTSEDRIDIQKAQEDMIAKAEEIYKQIDQNLIAQYLNTP